MRLCLTLAPDASAPARARVSLRALSLGLSPHVLRDVQLVVSELVANAVEHGPRESVRVEVELAGRDHVRGEVVDQGAAGAPAIRGADGDPENLGLTVVDELTTGWGVRSGSTHVWFELARG
jgi:anti-sigma regulatory factor (Ser/Thr protein kinase)